MCDACREEYENPLNRRFHAQPIACPVCGPSIQLWDEIGNVLAKNNDALKLASEKIKIGNIVALKGLGGFHLIVDASNEEAVKRLRERKHHEEKPFALMFPILKSIENICFVSEVEGSLLSSPESPIVLLKKKHFDSKIDNRQSSSIDSVAPSNPYLGIMLPYSPLHHLLMRELKTPVVATSGNISDEPICIDEDEALIRLKGITDFFLVHNRPIVRPVDDSIVRIVMNRPMVIRRARGFAPLPIQQNNRQSKNILAVGAHLKNTIAFIKDNNVFISQHIGDLSTSEANENFYRSVNDYTGLYKTDQHYIACDLHPDYISTKFALSQNSKIIPVQHHVAHIASCMLENQIEKDVLGVAWDGTGYGLDETIWGGEFFIVDKNDFRHVAQFKKYKLPGGEKAITDIKRSAIGLLYELFGSSFSPDQIRLFRKIGPTDLNIILKMLKKNINCFETSSVGRLFDAVSYILGIAERSFYEGQAAMMLEFAADPNEVQFYSFKILKTTPIVIDWMPMLRDILRDIEKNVSSSIISGKFHNTLVEIILRIAKIFNQGKIVLSGGCFQNILLLERAIKKLEANNFKVYWHQRVPTNDGGISLGQIAYAIREINKQSKKDRNINRLESKKPETVLS
jgi:hydrogenase maturation protein HypF